MKLESIVFAIAGVFFGLIVGWVIGSQQATNVAPRAAQVTDAPPQTPPAQAGGTAARGANRRTAILDENRVQALRTVADRDPNNATARAELADLYFDAERYDEAIKWYEDALKVNPKDVNISTDLGISYYYTNQTDRAIKQFDYSLGIDPKHIKTLLNMGIVRAFGKQDLQGATAAWKQVIDLAPGSPEGEAAKRALDSIEAAHPNLGSGNQSGTAR